MRILLTTDTVGGVWTFTRTLTEQLLRRGHSVALVSFGRNPTMGQLAWTRSMRDLYGAGFLYRSSEAPLEWMQENSTSFSGGVDLLLATADAFAVELLHSNQFCWGALPTDLPRFITAHSDVLSWAAACRPEGMPQSAWLDQYRAVVQSGLDRTDAVVAPTFWMQSALQEHFSLSCPLSVIPNGRTLSEDGIGGDRRLQAVSAGRLWDEAKGFDVLRGAGMPLPILLAGENQFDGASADMDGVHLAGFLEETELHQLFRESAIYLAASIYEPFGLAALEAALCGCAVVARSIPSLREVWEEGATYFDDASGLRNVLREFQRDPVSLRCAQQRAQERARTFSAERMASAYLRLYDSFRPESNHFPEFQEQVTHVA